MSRRAAPPGRYVAGRVAFETAPAATGGAVLMRFIQIDQMYDMIYVLFYHIRGIEERVDKFGSMSAFLHYRYR